MGTHLKISWALPSGKRLHSYRKAPFLIGKPSISMGHFPVRYVSLPEGMLIYFPSTVSIEI